MFKPEFWLSSGKKCIVNNKNSLQDVTVVMLKMCRMCICNRRFNKQKLISCSVGLIYIDSETKKS